MSDIIKRTVKGGAYFFSTNVITKVLGFIFVVICSRYLGPHDFGILSLGLSVTGFAKNLGSFGLPTTIQRFLSGGGEVNRSKNIYGSVIFLFLVLSIISSLGLYFLSPTLSNVFFDEPDLELVLKVFAFGLMVEIGFIIFKGVFQSQEQVKEILISSATYSVLRVLLLIVVFIWIQEAFVAAIVTEVSLFVALVYLVSCLKKIPLKIDWPSKKDILKVLSYSLPLVFVGFSYFLAQQTDRIMLGWLSTSSDVGVYTVSSTLAFVMTALHGSLVSIFMPIASKAYRDKNLDKLNETYLFISKWVSSVNGVISLLFAGVGMLLLSIFGSEYSTDVTYQILLILTVLYFVGTWVGPTGALLQMADGHKVEMYNTSIYLVLNIGLNYIFILQFGLIGAAWGTLIAGIVRNLLQVLEIRYYYKLNVINKTNLKLLVLVLGGITLCVTLNNYSLYISLIFICLVVVFVWKNINEMEKKLLIQKIWSNKK